MNKERAERLLRSFEQGGQGPVEDPLTPLLAALQPPPASGELPGEAAALHAFRHAEQLQPEPAPPRWRRFAKRFARMSTTRLIIVGVAATSVGGGSLALAGGSVKLPAHVSRPGHHQHTHHRPPSSPPPVEHQRPERTASPHPSFSRPGWPGHDRDKPGHWSRRPGHPFSSPTFSRNQR